MQPKAHHNVLRLQTLSNRDFNGTICAIHICLRKWGIISTIGRAIWNKSINSDVGSIYNAGRHTNLLDSYSENLVGYFGMSSLDASTGLSDSISTIYDRSGNSNHSSPQNADAGDLASSPNAEPNGYAKGDTNRSTTKP